MDELADSTSLLNDQDELRRRLAGDGYLFFRGLLPAAEVRTVGDAVLNRLRAGGWADDRGIPTLPPRAVNSMDALADPAFRAAMSGAAFNRLPYLPPLRGGALKDLQLRGLRAQVGAAHRQPLRLGAAAITVYRQHGVLEVRVWPLVTW